MTPIMKPTPTTCMAISLEIPKRLHASGIRSSEPPATPDAPQADIDATRLSSTAVGKSTVIPRVLAVANVSVVMVTAPPAILIVAPSGMETEYCFSSSPSLSQRDMLTGMLAAELLVKKAIIPLSLRHLNTSGYGFCLIFMKTINGFITSATTIMQPTSTAIRCP